MMTGPAMLKQYDEVLAGARNLQSTPDFWKEQAAANPMQQLKSAWTDVQAVLLSIGQIALPMVTAELKVFDGALRAIAGVFNLIPSWLQGTIVKGVGNAATGGALGAAKGIYDFLSPKPTEGVPAGKFEKQSYNVIPPQKTDIHHNVTTLNIDGAQLASFIDQKISQMHELPDSASAANGVAAYTDNDWNPRSVTG
jgi:hypothetical protein